MLIFNKYNRFYKDCLFDYGMVYADIMSSNFPYKRDFCSYIYNSLVVLKSEYDNNLYEYKESNDKCLFKINIYLLGLELQGFLSYLLSVDVSVLDKSNVVYFNKLVKVLDNLISRIHCKMCKWKSSIK